MKGNIYLLSIVLIVFFSSCNSIKQIKPYGDIAVINFGKNYKRSCEILSVEESHLLVVSPPLTYDHKGQSQPKIYRVAKEKIAKIEIEGYANRDWVAPVLIFQVLPAILLTVAAGAAGAEMETAGYLILYGPPLISLLLFSSSTPDAPGYENPIDTDMLQELRKYARYPQGLSNEQLNALLTRHHQEEPEILL